MEHTVKPEVLSEVENALRTNVSVLSAAVKEGNESFSKTVTDIIRPVMVSSLRRHTDKEVTDFLNDIDIYQNWNEIDDEIDAQAVENILGKATNLLKEQNLLYKAVIGSLGIATSIVAPWIEVIVLFLPEIANGISSIFRFAREKSIDERIRKEIIPKVIFQIDPKLDEIINNIERSILAEIKKSFLEQMTAINEAIENSRKAKEEGKASCERRVVDIDSDLCLLQSISGGIII